MKTAFSAFENKCSILIFIYPMHNSKGLNCLYTDDMCSESPLTLSNLSTPLLQHSLDHHQENCLTGTASHHRPTLPLTTPHTQLLHCHSRVQSELFTMWTKFLRSHRASGDGQLQAPSAAQPQLLSDKAAQRLLRFFASRPPQTHDHSES